jgi:hypothetical protein
VNAIPLQIQENGILNQMLISGMDSLNALARKRNEIEIEIKK